ncbi:MAG: hypothetical protein IPI44_24165 [Sulfuritalea sp.]|nr:hypothetical protein [Sulfuritalea sp.]
MAECHPKPGRDRLLGTVARQSWDAAIEAPRYLRGFEIDGGAGAQSQYGVSVFEFGKDGWTGSTAMVANADRGLASRRRYMEKQRDGFLLFRK